MLTGAHYSLTGGVVSGCIYCPEANLEKLAPMLVWQYFVLITVSYIANELVKNTHNECPALGFSEQIITQKCN